MYTNSISSSASYRDSGYSTSMPTTSQIYYGPSSSVPRPYHCDNSRHSPYNEDNFADDSRKTYGSRESFSPSTVYNQSCDRRYTSLPELHMPSPTPYRGYYCERISALTSSSVPQIKPELSPVLDHYNFPSHSNLTAEKNTFAIPSERSPTDPDYWVPNPAATHPLPRSATRTPVSPISLPKPKKTRPQKPRIELAPDQPPTTQGRPRARVYVACVQCRSRKIRCDGANPVCHNCSRRPSGVDCCTYDSAPKRRGPDKRPGARQRMISRASCGEDYAILSSRRRGSRASTSSNETVATNEFMPQDIPAVAVSPRSPLTPLDERSIPLPSVQYSPGVGGDVVVLYSRQCGCHGAVDCPSLFPGVYTYPDNRKSSMVVRDTLHF
ncbi:hypothetical protein FA15DRAFT_103884 [Coprinopsis marcescibilis]|uniref:Zn(2)-C6 fungal-type domain-containing protein n=1 Tax=Coprinopsis marcescibilis TaxID=230819 RepID=A0A5C3L4L3_COPMA|nr:hypothetical protein FA15DRAFT_103884 [Coprinopsis marcescibilis]